MNTTENTFVEKEPKHEPKKPEKDKVFVKCSKCDEQYDCGIYQSWLNDRDCCCPKRVEYRRTEEKRGNR